jgi:uncharacterized protein DUF4399/uncharacterized protein DUF6130
MAFRVGGALFLTAAMAAAACGGSSPESKPADTAAPASAPAADHTAHAGGKVFFKEPKDGASVKSPVHIVFGSDMFTIAPVPEGEVTTVRANTGHYHLGVDTDCLAAGSVIPKANPWVHFGKGNDNIDMQLTPGPHKLVVQAGDDKHATMTGLCEVINVNVTE